MSFLDKLRGMLGGSAGKPRTGGRGGAGGGSSFGDDAQMHLIYARCRRCGEPLLGRVNMMNEPSQEEDDTWVVRKTLSGGGGKNYCFQTVEVTLQFDRPKKNVLSAEASGGTLISAEEYAALVAAQAAAAEAAQDDAAASDDDTPQVKEA